MKKKYLLLLVFLVFVVTGCSKENINGIASNDNKGHNLYYTFTDSLGNSVVLGKRPERVVSLVGSYAETWLLAGGEITGVTDDVINEGRLEALDVISIVGTVKDPNVEKILSLSPDFILLSPDIENHLKIAEIFKQANIAHAYFKVEYFEDYLKMLDICTDITGKKDLYQEYGLKIKENIDDILLRIVKNSADKPEVLFVRAFSSGAKAKKDDNLTCRMLEDLGTVNIANKHPSLLEELSIEEIINEDPDYIFVTTMGNTEKAIEALKNGIERNPAWKNLTAVRNDRYIILPKELFHYKPNAKWGESYRYLAKILYPEIFSKE